ncbi:hypothetical protein B484DRAFT_391855 [Ochromonadaceae sp. CCMP2298]|nr:hypothetical protein B484DRAFT_391855 [Ochromonadaceae sp. CCMP2298]
MFDEKSNEFMLACAMDSTLQKTLIFTTLRDCHLRSFKDISTIVDNHHPLFVARMSR